VTRDEFFSQLKFEPFEAKGNEDEWCFHPDVETMDRVRPGVALKLKSGRVLLVGNCVRFLGSSDEWQICDYRDIVAIAYLWGDATTNTNED
jgi:hypothetical protein